VGGLHAPTALLQSGIIGQLSTPAITLPAGTLAPAATATVAGPVAAFASADVFAGTTLNSNLVFKSGMDTAQPQAGDLGGSFVSLSASLTGGQDENAAAEGDLPGPAPHSSRTADKAKETTSINWGNDLDAVQHLASGPSNGSQEWLDDFLNHLGQDETQWNPNASMRVRPTSLTISGAG